MSMKMNYTECKNKFTGLYLKKHVPLQKPLQVMKSLQVPSQVPLQVPLQILLQVSHFNNKFPPEYIFPKINIPCFLKHFFRQKSYICDTYNLSEKWDFVGEMGNREFIGDILYKTMVLLGAYFHVKGGEFRYHTKQNDVSHSALYDIQIRRALK